MVGAPGAAQPPDPVRWSLTLEPSGTAPGGRIIARLEAAIEPGWHLYSLTTPPGPIATTVEAEESPAVALYRVYQQEPEVYFDKNFNSNVEVFGDKASIAILIETRSDLSQGSYPVTFRVRYQVCDDRQCLLPVRRAVSAVLKVDPALPLAAAVVPGGYRLVAPDSQAHVSELGARGETDRRGMGMFLLIAFGFGLAAVFTPCVFPMIPITVSFFLKQREGAVWQASLFAAGIVVLFSAFGLAATAVLGPFGVVQLASSPWVNALVALLLFAFGLSLLGLFDIRVPSSLLTGADRLSRRGGALGALLMGLAFSLGAFACVGPFVGTLLAGSLTAGGLRPLAGMVAFAAGLALPFFGLALFPSLLGRLPKSGGWMTQVKVVFGFVVMAAALKYAANVDAVLQWNLLTRARFLAIWVVLFAMPGVYLLAPWKWWRGGRPATAAVLAGSLLLLFAMRLVPGVLGGSLGELDAYAPLAAGAKDGWIKNGYAEALAEARLRGKPVLVSFTGYACANCHWMKANMFTRPEIAAELANFVLLELYTDGTDASSRKNRVMLGERFATAAIPFYAVVDADERVLAAFAGLTRKPSEFREFLRRGSRRPTE